MNKRLTDHGFVKSTQGIYLCGSSSALITDEILTPAGRMQESPLKRCRINFHPNGRALFTK